MLIIENHPRNNLTDKQHQVHSPIMQQNVDEKFLRLKLDESPIVVESIQLLEQNHPRLINKYMKLINVTQNILKQIRIPAIGGLNRNC